jgi:hypothetical protein
MSDIYPLSMHCRFEGFPARIRVVCGRAFSEARGTPFSYGSRVDLSRTPQSGVLAGALVPGEPLPALETVYSDTGDDHVFNLKVAHYGYGRFYLGAAGDACYTLAVIKGLRVEALGICRSFETVDVWETRIPAATDLTAVPAATSGPVVVQDADPGAGTSVVWFGGDVPGPGLVVRGSLQLGGGVHLQI